MVREWSRWKSSPKRILMKSNPKIVAGKYVRETFFEKNPHLTEEDLLSRVRLGLNSAGCVRQGYREGVYLVALPDVSGFKRRIRSLVPGDHFFGEFKARVKGEAPRKKIKVLHVGDLPDATHVDAVLYATHVLAESGDEHDPTADFELVTFLAKDFEGEEPMDVETLLHNHFLSDGGTSTKMSNDEFVEALRKSHDYWKTRAHIF